MGNGLSTETQIAVEIDVTLPGLLRDSVDGAHPLRVTGATLDEALSDLLARFPRLRVHLYDEQGTLRPHVLIYYNDDNIAWLDSLDLPLRPGDQVHILQAVSGG